MSVPSDAIQTYEGYVKNGDVRIHFFATGQGPLLLLLHGFPDNAETWSKQVTEFSKRYTVVCPTLRGYPPSDIPNDPDAYDLGTVAGDVLKILDHFKTHSALVGGHDFGGAVLQYLAMVHPERVAGLIIINSPIVPRLYELVNFDNEQQRLSEYTLQYLQYQSGDLKNEEYIVRNIRDRDRRGAVRDYLMSSPVHGMLAYYKKNYPAPPYGQKVDTSLMLYKIPTLIIWGLKDEFFSLKILDSISQHFLNTVRLVTLPSAGHWSFRDESIKVNREIKSWLDELSHIGIEE